MSVYNVKSDFYSMKRLHQIGKFFAILPNFNVNNLDGRVLVKFYPLIWITFSLAGYIYATVAKFCLMYGELHISVYILDCICDISVTMLTVCAIIGINWMHGDKICDFLTNLLIFDRTLKTMTEIKTNHFRYCVELVLTHIYFIFYYIYYSAVWLNTVGIDIFKIYFLRDLFGYNTLVLAMILRNYVLTLRTRFEILNSILSKFKTDEDYIALMVCSENSAKKSNNVNLAKIKRMYMDLLIMLNDYNKIFGWQYVTLYINIVVSLLYPVNLALVYGTGERTLGGIKFGTQLIVLSMLWASFPTIVAGSTFSACSDLTNEASDTRFICYKIIRDLSQSDKDRYVKEELLDLAQQSTDCHDITASGFYTVNYGMLFALVGSIGSYIIVLVQFSK